MWQREDDVEVADGKQFGLPVGQPTVARRRLALGTVAIAAGVIGDGTIAASRTFVEMSTQRRRSAARNGPEHFQVGPVNPVSVVLDEAIALCANDIGHLEGWPGHFFWSLRDRFVWLESETSSESIGLGAACRWRLDRCK